MSWTLPINSWIAMSNLPENFYWAAFFWGAILVPHIRNEEKSLLVDSIMPFNLSAGCSIYMDLLRVQGQKGLL